jgi:hypothetical protein
VEPEPDPELEAPESELEASEPADRPKLQGLHIFQLCRRFLQHLGLGRRCRREVRLRLFTPKLGAVVPASSRMYHQVLVLPSRGQATSSQYCLYDLSCKASTSSSSAAASSSTSASGAGVAEKSGFGRSQRWSQNQIRS